MTFGSLFAGIGGMDLGLERAGMECRWQVEIDPFCRKVLAKHWPNVKRYEDIRTVDWREVERVDLIAGGFPCQDISNAGKRVGIGGERSGLWSEFARAVCALRPRVVLVENVAALRQRGIGRVLGDLAESGYHAWTDGLPAAAFGASHERDRVFIVAYARGSGLSTRRLVSLCAESIFAMPAGRCSDAFPACRTHDQRAWEERRLVESPMGAASDGISGRLVRSRGRDAIRAAGNAVVPQVAEWIGRRILEAPA